MQASTRGRMTAAAAQQRASFGQKTASRLSETGIPRRMK